MADEPVLPFLRFNKHHVCGFSVDDPEHKSMYMSRFLKMRKIDFDAGRFKESATIIDAHCRKFPILDVVSLGPSFNFWDIVLGQNRVRIKYIFGPPIHLTFDQAREEVVELICNKRWFSKTQDRESQKNFRARMALCNTMQELIIGYRATDPKLRRLYNYIGGISFYGEWVG